MNEPALSRRARQRQATMDEIVSTAREQLPEPGGLSLRAIAQQMGITPPALYRYVSSLEDLTLTVAATIYDELVEVLREAARRQHAYGPEAQIVAAAIAYRKWSLRHRDEFVLCFVNEVTDPDAPGQNACAAAGHRFRQFFAELFVQIWHLHPFDVPDDVELGPVAGQLYDELNPFLNEYRQWLDDDVPAGAQWVFLQVWTRLFGIVALEVFGHIAPVLVESGALFGAVVRDCGAMIGIDAEDERLQAVVAAELA